MTIKNLVATLLGVGMLAAVPSAAVAASDLTFSFETPNANYLTVNPTGYSGVTFNNASGVSIQGGPLFGVTPPDGTQAAFVQSSFSSGVGAISFALTGLSAGTAYSTSFFLATRPNYGVSATTSGPTTPLSVDFNGLALGSFAATSVNFTQFTALDFIATAATGTLTFSGNPLIYGDVNLDLVKVTPSRVAVPVAGTVPEPASWAMMVGGFGLLGTAMRRRKVAVSFL